MRNKTFYKIGLGLQWMLLLGHLYYCRHGMPIPVVDATSRMLVQLMGSYEIHYIGGVHTLDETIWGYDFTWALYVLFIFAVSLLALRHQPRSRRLGRHLALLNTLLWLGALIVTLVYWSIPQQSLFALLTLTFFLSYWLEWKQPSPKDTRICVVGAGISGLTAAYELQQQGYTQVTVLEKADEVGGKCFTAEFFDQPFDLGGHEMLAGYNDLVDIAEDLGAPTSASIRPLVYDHDKKQYFNFKQAATISGKYSMTQVMLASLKYLWLVVFPFRRISNPATGYSRMPAELALPLEEWLVQRRLVALTDILSFVVKVQGYGRFTDTSAAYLVKFMGWRNWLSLLLSGIGLSTKWPRVLTLGAANFCRRLAAGLQVRLRTNITRIVRSNEPGAAPVRIYLAGQSEPLVFDKLILSTPLELSGLHFLDVGAEEEVLFRQIRHFHFYTTVCEVQGLPAGVVASVPLNDIRRGQYTGYIKSYPTDPAAIFFSLAGHEVTGEEIEQEIVEVLAAVPDYDGQKPGVIRFLEQKGWHYFPHVSPQAVAEKYYDRLEALQGQRHTFYASSALAFECMGNSVAYARRLMLKHF